MNAIKHGNLEDQPEPSEELKARKVQVYVSLKGIEPVTLERVTQTGNRVVKENADFLFQIDIRDEGRGFSTEAVPDPTEGENLEKPSGRGLLLMYYYMDAVDIVPVPKGTHIHMAMVGTRNKIGSLEAEIAV